MILAKIVEAKRGEVEKTRKEVPQREVEEAARNMVIKSMFRMGGF